LKQFPRRGAKIAVAEFELEPIFEDVSSCSSEYNAHSYVRSAQKFPARDWEEGSIAALELGVFSAAVEAVGVVKVDCPAVWV
jgi:hypothetical protein